MQALAECAQDANFVVDAVDPILARGVLLHHDVAPFWGDHPIQRGFVGGVIRPGVVPVGFEYLQRLDDRSMHGVVGLGLYKLSRGGHKMSWCGSGSRIVES